MVQQRRNNIRKSKFPLRMKRSFKFLRFTDGSGGYPDNKREKPNRDTSKTCLSLNRIMVARCAGFVNEVPEDRTSAAPALFIVDSASSSRVKARVASLPCCNDRCGFPP